MRLKEITAYEKEITLQGEHAVILGIIIMYISVTIKVSIGG